MDVFKDDEGKFRVSMNIFLFDGIMFYPFLKDCEIHPKRNEKELPTAILKMIEEYSDSMQGIPLAEHVPDLTAKTDIHTMKEYLLKHEFKVDWFKK